jgi:hypothetical protein
MKEVIKGSQDTVRASNFEPHGNFEHSIAKSVVPLGEFGIRSEPEALRSCRVLLACGFLVSAVTL